MTKRESVLISVYTGHMLCEKFEDLHQFIEETLDRPVFTHELANEEVQKEIKEKLKPDIIKLIENIQG